MKLRDLEVLVVGNPPPGFGGRYFIFVKLTTDDGVVGWGEVYAATVGPEAMRAVIADVFARHMQGESPENVELMFRRAYSAGFSQRPDPTVMGAFLQITGEVEQDLAVPDKPFDFALLQAAQAAGDRKAIADRGRPLLHLHLTDRAAGLAQLREALA